LLKVARGDSAHRALVGAHALMSLNDDALDALRDLANDYGVGMHLQVAEDGSDAVDAERRKSKLAQRLHTLDAVRPGSVLAECNELPPEMLPGIGDKGAFIVSSPRSNARQGLRTFQGSGAHVALGTDGLDGDVLEEARAYALRHREMASEVGQRLAAGQILAAYSYGDRTAPRFLPGARADFAIWDYQAVTPLHAGNLVEHLLRGFHSQKIRHTICGGRFIVRDGKLATTDEAALFQRARLAAARVWERMQAG
jgi:cytosine/adenosine deaminase-related metal-dependent hydrolase